LRIKIVNIVLISSFLFAAAGVFNLSVLKGNKFKELSNKNCIRILPQPGARGKIFDRKARVIVDNYLTYDVLILSQNKEETDRTLSRVSQLLKLDLNEIKKKFRAGYSASFLPVCIIENVDIKKAIALEELKFDSPGIIIQARPLRHYPYNRLASHLLGYLNEIDLWRLNKLSDYGYNVKDIVGYGGIEEKYDYFLRQQEGIFSVEVNHRGKFVRVLGYKPPQNGRDIQLTIDLEIQKIVEANLNGRDGSVVIMDPNTGEIIAMASYPDFNPAVFVERKGEDLLKTFGASKESFLNRAISGIYPPGSIFKNIVAVAALESSKINFSTTFFCPGKMAIGNREFACWNTHHEQDLIGALAHSCDVFFYSSGLRLGGQGIYDYAIKFGLAHPTDIDLPYEAKGFVPSPLWKRIHKLQNWFDGDTANFSIGQGDLMVTPIQMARMIAVFANDGWLVNPFVAKNISGYDITSYHRKSIKVPFKERNIRRVCEGLRKVVTDRDGTANVLSTVGISVAGKTGTVQVPHGQSHAWFAGYFPYELPKYVICVMLEHGGSGSASVSLAKQIIERMIQENLIVDTLTPLKPET
jgi:penicillin-binding protein 2